MNFKKEFNMQIHAKGRRLELQRKGKPRASWKVCPGFDQYLEEKETKKQVKKIWYSE